MYDVNALDRVVVFSVSVGEERDDGLRTADDDLHLFLQKYDENRLK